MENTATSPGANPVKFQKFRGNYLHSLDPKKRVVVPAKWRDEANGEFQALLASSGDHLWVMTEPEYDRIIDEHREKCKVTGKDPNVFVGQLNSTVHTMTFDSQGRMTIASKHCEKLGLKNEVKLVGHDTRFTIWKPETWDAALGTDEAQEDMNQSLSELGL